MTGFIDSHLLPDTSLHGPHGKHESRARMRSADYIENISSSSFAKTCMPHSCLEIEIFIVAWMCLANRCLATDVLLLRARVLLECVTDPLFSNVCTRYNTPFLWLFVPNCPQAYRLLFFLSDVSARDVFLWLGFYCCGLIRVYLE